MATRVFAWRVAHEVGISFEDPGLRAVDRVSDAHDMVCIVLSCIPQPKRDTTRAASSSKNPNAADGAVLDDATDRVDPLEEHTSSSEESDTADADELGDATNPMADLDLDPNEAVRFQVDGARAFLKARETLLQAAAAAVDYAREASDEKTAPPTTHDRNRDRSRSPSRWRPRSRSESYSPTSDRSADSPILVNGKELPSIFLADLQDMLWPVKFQQRDRPADLLSFEPSLSPVVKMDPPEATASVAGLILALRQVALDRRVAEARRSSTFPVAPNSDAPLTYKEMGWVLDFWKGKFREQTLTKQQAAQDWAAGLNNTERKKMSAADGIHT